MGVKTVARIILGQIAEHYAYELKAISSPTHRHSHFMNRVAKIRARPERVFDVGLGHGTVWRYGISNRSTSF